MTVNDTSVPPHLYEKILAQASADPGPPVANPTTSYWQLPPHPSLSSIQSEHFPETTDFAIIGSGVTGLSIAKHLLEHGKVSAAKITVLEARTLCSGASGRNGGGLATFVPYAWPQMCSQYGTEKAIELAKFMYRTLEKMHSLGRSNEQVKKTSEIRRTRDVTGFRDRETFEEMRDSFLSLEEAVPEAQLQVEVYDEAEALKVCPLAYCI
jgi:glycine/D-amino acid oxidase-like deaminating enzyme